jgi:hypothetical protein
LHIGKFHLCQLLDDENGLIWHNQAKSLAGDRVLRLVKNFGAVLPKVDVSENNGKFRETMRLYRFV